jgi:signal peptidase II
MLIKKIFWINAFCLIFFILDRVLKQIALSEKLKSFLNFNFSLSLNKGIALSLPLAEKFLYFLLIIIIFWLSAVILKSYQKKELTNILGLSLILTGTFSNLFDRILYGAVIDYFLFWEITIFNLADVMILTGGAIILWKTMILNQPFFKS